MSYLKSPNLPEKTVQKVIVSGEISEKSEYTLNELGIECVKTSAHPKLYNAVKYHPDMQIYHLGGEYAVCDINSISLATQLFSLENICSGESVEEKYPRDIYYNAARVGQFLICNRSYTDDNIIKNAVSNGLEIVNVKQGYAKCNLCIVSENAVITSDIGIKSALGNFPVDVLLVEDNSVALKDFTHGFFGGATGKIAPDKLAVNGNIKYHLYYNEIITFANKYNVEIVSLNNDCIEDIGSILPILEK